MRFANFAFPLFVFVAGCASGPSNLGDGGVGDGTACSAGGFRCDGDTLYVCANDGEHVVITCPAGRCDATNGRCSDCQPGKGACTGLRSRRVCGDDGKSYTDENCPQSAQYCVSGECVQCLGAEDCNSTMDCQGMSCVAGKCTVTFDLAGSSCGDAGVCNGKGTCGTCKPGSGACNASTPLVCTEQGAWQVQTACKSPLPFCVAASGTCGECLVDTDCAPAGPCNRVSCDPATNKCVKTSLPVGAVCNGSGSCNATGVCTACTPATKACNGTTSLLCNANGSFETATNCSTQKATPYCYLGSCVECVDEQTCPSPAEGTCLLRACISGKCQLTPAPLRTACIPGGGTSTADAGKIDSSRPDASASGLCGGPTNPVCYFECIPNDTDCKSGELRKCDLYGHWQGQSVPCP